jgi:hypothetical protein
MADNDSSQVPRLTPSQEQRAVEILLDHIPENYWTDYRKLIRAKSESLCFQGTGIRNCLRLYGFLDRESPTGNLDDVWEFLAARTALAAEKSDWASEKKKWPARTMRTDIQGFSRMLGERIWSSCYKGAEDLSAELVQAAESRHCSFKGKEALLRREAIIATMWIVSDNWKFDKDALEVMHDCFFFYAGVADEKSPDNPTTLRDINERYNFFFTSKGGSTASLLTCLLTYIMGASGSLGVDTSFCEFMNTHLTRTLSGLKTLV